VVVGSHERRARLVRRANELLSGLVLAAAP
jgi:hypothetical protein